MTQNSLTSKNASPPQKKDRKGRKKKKEERKGKGNEERGIKGAGKTKKKNPLGFYTLTLCWVHPSVLSQAIYCSALALHPACAEPSISQRWKPMVFSVLFLPYTLPWTRVWLSRYPSTHGNFSKTLIPPKFHYPIFCLVFACVYYLPCYLFLVLSSLKVWRDHPLA